MNVLINIIAFKIGWLSSVLGAANDVPLLGPAVVMVAVAIHLRLANDPSRELMLIVLTGIIGASADSVMVASGWLVYPTGTVISGFAPFWILGMWMLFATTFNMAFRWLHSKYVLAAALGAISGPATYFFGAKIGAVVINDVPAAMIALAVAWGAMMPGLLMLARRFDGVSVQIETSRI